MLKVLEWWLKTDLFQKFKTYSTSSGGRSLQTCCYYKQLLFFLYPIISICKQLEELRVPVSLLEMRVLFQNVKPRLFSVQLTGRVILPCGAVGIIFFMSICFLSSASLFLSSSLGMGQGSFKSIKII